jgi:hypothetical protein
MTKSQMALDYFEKTKSMFGFVTQILFFVFEYRKWWARLKIFCLASVFSIQIFLLFK